MLKAYDVLWCLGVGLGFSILWADSQLMLARVCVCVITALLTLYFLTYLKWDKDLSTAVYHAFSGLCYFTPILGAFIADSWLGKYKWVSQL